jgi:hypothetical protein
MKNEFGRTLNIQNGLAVLRAPGYPSLPCELIELDETECICRVNLYTISDEIGHAWSRLLQSNATFEICIIRPPQLTNFTAAVRVVYLDQRASELNMKLHLNCTDEKRKRLNEAMIRIAASKLRDPVSRYQSIEIPPIAAKMNPADERLVNSDVPGIYTTLPEALLKASQLREKLIELRHNNVNKGSTEHTEGQFDQRINRLLLENQEVTPDDLCHALAIDSKLPVIDLDIDYVTASLSKTFTCLTLLRFQIVPFAETNDLVCIAAAEPLSEDSLKHLEEKVNRHVMVFLAPADQIHALQSRIHRDGLLPKRVCTRVKIVLPVFYQICNEQGILLNNVCRQGETIDLTEHGALIVGPEESLFPASQLVENGYLKLQIDKDGCDIRAIARILRISPSQNLQTAKWLYGLEIFRIEKPNALKIRELCEMAAESQFATDYEESNAVCASPATNITAECV